MWSLPKEVKMIFSTHQFFLLSHQNSSLTQEAELRSLEQSQGQEYYKNDCWKTHNPRPQTVLVTLASEKPESSLPRLGSFWACILQLEIMGTHHVWPEELDSGRISETNKYCQFSCTRIVLWVLACKPFVSRGWWTEMNFSQDFQVFCNWVKKVI